MNLDEQQLFPLISIYVVEDCHLWFDLYWLVNVADFFTIYVLLKLRQVFSVPSFPKLQYSEMSHMLSLKVAQGSITYQSRSPILPDRILSRLLLLYSSFSIGIKNFVCPCKQTKDSTHSIFYNEHRVVQHSDRYNLQ